MIHSCTADGPRYDRAATQRLRVVDALETELRAAITAPAGNGRGGASQQAQEQITVRLNARCALCAYPFCVMQDGDDSSTRAVAAACMRPMRPCGRRRPHVPAGTIIGFGDTGAQQRPS